MDVRASIRRFAAVAVLCVAGLVVVLATRGRTGDLVGWGLVAIGLIGAVSLIFLEVGLSEDRDRERHSGQ